MGIIVKDGMNFFDGLNSGWIAVESDRIDDYLNYIKSNKVVGIALNSSYYKADNVDFLTECPSIERISITSSYVINYSGLNHQKQLRDLCLEEPKGRVDISCFNLLEVLSTEMNKNIIGIDGLQNLKVLRLWKYKPKSGNLKDISTLSNVEELVLTQSPIISLEGCGNFTKLQKLELNYLSKLEYIDELEKNRETLKHLRFDSCKRIKNHEYVTSLKELELLAFDECGDIPSIGFIRKIPKLKSFIFVNTNIVDGDLSPCIGLEYVGFLNKKHYSHKVEDFKKK